ncbi:pimeloyl-CoA dehydrogenase small subunit [Pseudomaricurvus alkylphenolicus]|uniref:acyl-CoA dehydrogenase family protein n=1 Tax=Pseudomaricurvus alkylphenolicus TaxID=1306991 RepID=UPI00141DDF51|nr:acyl-CoA dehydrogenase family protein [Pseudomaricurvus alkylphenolicus]NIB41714.1 pimeloyl-CoA dehydrogenase small subunit [Pseudomaricurvus alkylphenolicus]
MDFDLSPEQRMLQESVSRFVQDAYDFETRTKVIAADAGSDDKLWQQFARLGWLAVPFAEDLGGIGGSAVDLMVIMEEFGKGLVAEPYVVNTLLFGGLLGQSQNHSIFSSLIERIIAGELQGAFAFLERQSRFELFDVTTRAEKDDNRFILNGEKTLVMNGAAAEQIIVLARTGGKQCHELGTTLFVVDANAEGIEKTGVRLMDGQKVANIQFNNVVVSAQSIVGAVDHAAPLVREVVARASLALCAEAVGIMEKLYTTTVEYTKVRKQFGVAIGSFQTLQHRMADMFIEYEQAKSLLYRTVCSIDEQADDIEKNILALKVMVGRAGKLIGGDAIQLHGGMGLTDELDVGHYVKRLMMINTMFGDADYSQKKFAQIMAA